jgi:hypothetical protein
MRNGPTSPHVAALATYCTPDIVTVSLTPNYGLCRFQISTFRTPSFPHNTQRLQVPNHLVMILLTQSSLYS